MKLCQMCWKNLKNEKSYILRNKINKNGYIICKKCRKTGTVQSLIDSEKWEIIEVEQNE